MRRQSRQRLPYRETLLNPFNRTFSGKIPAAKKVVDKLLSLALVQEVLTTRDQPAWRADESGGPVASRLRTLA